jgi:hypothetical protein
MRDNYYIEICILFWNVETTSFEGVISLWVFECVLKLLNFKSVCSFLYARLETGRIMWLGVAGGRPHNNFSSVYRIFTKLGHMIPL